MGAVNAIATLAGCLPAVIWWACHRPNRLWWRYTAWWALALVLAMLWWVVALVLLGPSVRRSWTSSSPPASQRNGRHWSRCCAAPTAGPRSSHRTPPRPPLVTGSAAILATSLVAAAGLAGLALGYAGPGTSGHDAADRRGPDGSRLQRRLGSPLAHHVQAFLDGAGAPLRNVHKLESVIRIPVVLGVAQLLGRIPLPGGARRAAAGVVQRLRPPGARQTGRRRDRGADRPDGRDVAGMDRPAHPARRVQRDTAVLA